MDFVDVTLVNLYLQNFIKLMLNGSKYMFNITKNQALVFS